MPASSLSSPLPVEDVDGAIAALRSRGLRASTARRVVLEALFAADGPVSAEAIADGIAGRVPRSDLASLYRNLETLEEIGMVRHFHLGHGPGLYALVREAEQEYLVCEACDSVRAVPASELAAVRETLRDQFGFHARFGHFAIGGLCAACAARRVGAGAHP